MARITTFKIVPGDITTLTVDAMVAILTCGLLFPVLHALRVSESTARSPGTLRLLPSPTRSEERTAPVDWLKKAALLPDIVVIELWPTSAWTLGTPRELTVARGSVGGS